MAAAEGLVADLRAALSADRVRDGATELSLYRHDASHMEGRAVAVCFPTSTAEVQACVRIAARYGVPADAPAAVLDGVATARAGLAPGTVLAVLAGPPITHEAALVRLAAAVDAVRAALS